MTRIVRFKDEEKVHPLLRGRELLLVNGSDRDDEGAIATQEEYDNFENSTAHLTEDGRILRHGAAIGSREDIEFVGPEDDS